MGDGTADGSGQGEARVEGGTRELAGLGSLHILDDGVDFCRAGALGAAGHCVRAVEAGGGELG